MITTLHNKFGRPSGEMGARVMQFFGPTASVTLGYNPAAQGRGGKESDWRRITRSIREYRPH